MAATSLQLTNRWVIAAAGFVMQLALGAANAWSVFRDPLIQAFGWTVSEVTVTYVLTGVVYTGCAVLGGLWLPRVGPRSVALAGVVLLCYGGGFATIAAFVADYFGPKHVGALLGLILTASGAAAVVGPLLMARARDASGGYAEAISIIAVMMLAGAVVPAMARPPRGRAAGAALPEDQPFRPAIEGATR